MSEEEKIEDQPADENPLSTENENISEDNPEPPTTNPKLLTENMEVHNHPHHVTHKKKWGEYLLEFFMLFLAVFLGFIAENQREHIVEQHRATEYAKSLYSDIQTDTNEIRRGVSMTKFILSSIDSLVSITSNQNISTHAPGIFYYYSRMASAIFRIDWSKSTIEQLTHSGNLRYFKNKELVEKINYYYYMQGVINQQNLMDVGYRDRSMDVSTQILQSRFYSKFVQVIPTEEQFGHKPLPEVDSLIARELPLQQGAVYHIDEFINHLCDRKSKLLPVVEDYYDDTNKIAIEIMQMIKEEYRLEKE